MIALAIHILQTLGLAADVTLEINSIGDAASRAAYRDALVAYLSQHTDTLSAESKVRLEKNPLRILDSKDAGDRAIIANAPVLHDYFNEASQQHFSAVKAGLDALGIAYKVSEKLVRGLDYYSHTVFEITTDKLGAQGTVLAGGRYNDLVKMFGGPDTACIGWAAGVERLVDLQGEQPNNTAPLAAIIPMGEAAELEACKLAHALRQQGIAVELGYKGKAGKRIERASKMGAKFAIMLGDDEIAQGNVTVKNLGDGTQRTLSRAELFKELES
jgi:histidyl-tRNA synthetase